MPTDTFFNLSDEKKRRILEAAIDEFAEYRFSDASINRIVKNADISRGSFYQYFLDKEDLYLFIMQVIGVFQVMSEPLAMTDGGPNNASMSLMLQSYLYGFRYFETGKSMAVSTITFLILIILTAFYFKVKNKVEKE